MNGIKIASMDQNEIILFKNKQRIIVIRIISLKRLITVRILKSPDFVGKVANCNGNNNIVTIDSTYQYITADKKGIMESPIGVLEDGRISVVAASHKRGIMACRNGHERTNGYVKRHKFCRSRINTNDIVNVAAVWNICLADMIHEDIVLTKDTERSNALADKILEMQPVLDNPLSAWWNDKI